MKRIQKKRLGWSLLASAALLAGATSWYVVTNNGSDGDSVATSANQSRAADNADAGESNDSDENTTTSNNQTTELPRLELPQFDVSAPIESVGRNEDGNMQEPSRSNIVSWYERGAFPGNEGNAVLAGHVDTPENPRGGIFGDLDQLDPGDEIIFMTEADEAITYRVSTMDIYPYDDAPLSEIFGETSYDRLTLITCSGHWNSELSIYEDRLVVIADRIDE